MESAIHFCSSASGIVLAVAMGAVLYTAEVLLLLVLVDVVVGELEETDDEVAEVEVAANVDEDEEVTAPCCTTIAPAPIAILEDIPISPLISGPGSSFCSSSAT